jgi:predicted outer membrane repeat protein
MAQRVFVCAMASWPRNGICETAPGNGVCTLRRALAEASRLLRFELPTPGDVTIVLAVPGGVVTLGQDPPLFPLDGRGRLSLLGPGQGATLIEATPTLRFFNLTVRISGLTLRNVGGSALLGTGTLFLDYVTIADSYRGLDWAGGDATLTGCDVRNNGGFSVVGGVGPSAMTFTTINPTPAFHLRIRHSTFRGNRGWEGGALDVGIGDVELDGVTFSDNHVIGNGGAMYLSQYATLRAVNTTFSGNSATDSGGALLVTGG